VFAQVVEVFPLRKVTVDMNSIFSHYHAVQIFPAVEPKYDRACRSSMDQLVSMPSFLPFSHNTGNGIRMH
jgi:hypothetical protein